MSETLDEPAHLACGWQWWNEGRYSYDECHPPLARIAASLGPQWQGSPFTKAIGHNPQVQAQGQRLLGESSRERILALGRAGILPFFVISSWCVWLWARNLFGDGGAAVAVLIYTTIPPILAHAGLITTDMAATAGVIAALYSIDRWFANSNWRSTITAGVGLGIALSTKFSAIVFLAVTIPVVILHRGRAGRQMSIRQLAAVLLTAFLLVWGTYRFSFDGIVSPDTRPHRIVTRLAGGSPEIERALNAFVEVSVPAPAFFRGISKIAAFAGEGQSGYLLGEYGTRGWLLFFPIALGVKTPLAVLALFFVGVYSAVRKSDVWSPGTAPVWIVLVILGSCIPSSINMGVRHILPIYPFLAIVAAGGLVTLAREWRSWGGPLSILLTISFLSASVTAHPDYIPFFNLLAGRTPENVLVESDLDWGQDFDELTRWATAHGITEMGVAHFGGADMKSRTQLKLYALCPYQRVSGWVAVSTSASKIMGMELREPGRADGAFDWLNAIRPYTMIGKTIRVFYIDGPALPRQVCLLK